MFQMYLISLISIFGGVKSSTLYYSSWGFTHILKFLFQNTSYWTIHLGKTIFKNFTHNTWYAIVFSNISKAFKKVLDGTAFWIKVGILQCQPPCRPTFALGWQNLVDPVFKKTSVCEGRLFTHDRDWVILPLVHRFYDTK